MANWRGQIERWERVEGRSFPERFDDDVYILWRKLASSGGLFDKLEDLSRGKVHKASEIVMVKGKKVKIKSDPDLPKQIRLANIIESYLYSLPPSGGTTRATAETWFDSTRAAALHQLESTLLESIRTTGIALDQAMRQPSFLRRINMDDPILLIEMMDDLSVALARSGALNKHLENINTPTVGTPRRHLLATDRSLELFDLLRVDASTGAFEVVTGGKFNGKTVDAAYAATLKAAIDKSAPQKAMKLYSTYRSHIVPALVLSRAKQLGVSKLTGSATAFKDFVADISKRSLAPFYPTSAGLKLTDSLADFRKDAEAFDAANPKRWSDLDTAIAASKTTRVELVDKFTVTAGSALGLLDFIAATEKMFTASSIKEADVKDLMVAGLSFTDDVLNRFISAAGGSSSKALRAAGSAAQAASQVVVTRALFVFAVIDFGITVKAALDAEKGKLMAANAVKLVGAAASVTASGLMLLAAAGLVSIPAAPAVILGLVGAVLGLLGSALISAFTETVAQKILQSSCFRDPKSAKTITDDILDLPSNSKNIEAGFVTGTKAKPKEDYLLQLSYIHGLVGGMGPSISRSTFGTVPQYKWAYTPFTKDLSNLSNDIKKLKISITALDAGASTVGAIENALRLSGSTSHPGGPHKILQTTTILGEPAFPEPMGVATARRIAELRGKAFTAKKRSPDTPIRERAEL